MANYHKKKKWVFYSNWFSLIQDLDDLEAGKLIKAISRFALDGEDNNISGEIKGIYRVIKSQLEIDGLAYEKACANKPKNGGAPKGNQNARKYENNQNNQNNQNKDDTDRQTDIDMIDTDIDMSDIDRIDISDIDMDDCSDLPFGSSAKAEAERPFKGKVIHY